MFVDEFAGTIVIGFEHDGPELLPPGFVVFRIVIILVLLQVCVFLVGCLGGVPERVQPFPLVVDLRFPANNLGITIQGHLELIKIFPK